MFLQVFSKYREFGGEEGWSRELEKDWGFPIFEECLPDFELASYRDKAFFVKDAIYNKRAKQRLEDYIQKKDPSGLIFHNLYPCISGSAYDAAFEIGLPVFQYIHNFRPLSISATLWYNGKTNPISWKSGFMRQILAGSYQDSTFKTAIMGMSILNSKIRGHFENVSCWFAISQFMKDRFICAGIDEDKIFVLRHYWKCRFEYTVFPDDNYYLFIGRLVEEKGVFVLLKAWRLLFLKLGNKCPALVIAGEGSNRSDVEKLAQGLPCVRLVGHVSGMEKHLLLSRCSGVVIPSIWWEPLGLVTYEAYEYGKPVASSGSGGLGETMVEMETGISHQPNCHYSLCDTVIELERMGYLCRQQMGAKGRRWLEKNANAEKWKENFDGFVSRFS